MWFHLTQPPITVRNDLRAMTRAYGYCFPRLECGHICEGQCPESKSLTVRDRERMILHALVFRFIAYVTCERLIRRTLSWLTK